MVDFRRCGGFALVVWAALALFAGPAREPRGAEPPPARGTVEIRLARNDAAPGYEAVSSGRFAGKVFVARDALFSNSDFSRARIANTGGGVALLLSFTPKAARRLSAFTRKSKGRELALLLDGRVLWVTAVGEPITDGEMALVTQMAYADAVAVAEALKK